jgi:regulator of cell morphogenesis and NO signaling
MFFFRVTLVTVSTPFTPETNPYDLEEAMNISSATKVKEIAVNNPGATKVLEEAGVDFCCGGNKSLADACAHAGVSTDDLLLRLRQASPAIGPSDQNWIAAPLAELTRHICEKHHRYVRQAIPSTQSLLAKVKAKHGEKHPEINEIEGFFFTVSEEMLMHMQKEEHILFPYIEALERAATGKEAFERPFFQTVRNPVHAMMQEHDAAGDLVKRIRAASSNYALPADGCASYQDLYRDLQQFENDLHQHVHLENNILFPRAVELEAAFL